MGSVKLPTSGIVYVDSQCLIYAVEGIPKYASVLRPMMDALDSRQIRIITSEITILEALVLPLRLNDANLIADYKRVLFRYGIDLIPVSQPILLDAARLRADHRRLKTPDSIHAATALIEQPQAFVTSDRDFAPITSLPALMLDDLITQP